MFKVKVVALQAVMILLGTIPFIIFGGAFSWGVLREIWEWLITGLVYMGLFWALGWAGIGYLSLGAMCADKIGEINYENGYYTGWLGFTRVRSPYND